MFKKNSEAGITLVELIVAIVLLGLAIPLIVGLMTSLTQINDRAHDTSLLNAIAENKVESLRSKGFNGVTNGTFTFTNELPTSIPLPRTASYTVSNVSASLKSIEVTISYGTRQIQYKTYLGELGVGQY